MKTQRSRSRRLDRGGGSGEVLRSFVWQRDTASERSRPSRQARNYSGSSWRKPKRSQGYVTITRRFGACLSCGGSGGVDPQSVVNRASEGQEPLSHPDRLGQERTTSVHFRTWRHGYVTVNRGIVS
jgi:hypothetical protein